MPNDPSKHIPLTNVDPDLLLHPDQTISEMRVPEKGTRCTHDSLDPWQAIDRMIWVAKCVHQEGDTDPNWADIKKYSWQSVSKLLVGFNHSNRSEFLRLRPGYYTFIKQKQDSSGKYLADGGWIAPLDPDASCQLPGLVAVADCISSCYTPEQELLFPDGYKPIVEAVEKRFKKIVTLSNDATLDSPTLMENYVESYSEELSADVKNNVIEFELEDGRSIKVTENHPLLNAEGKMLQASEFKQGDSLVDVSGDLIRINKLSSSLYTGKVYNVKPVSKFKDGDLVLNSQIVVVNGILSGSSYFQNDGYKYLNDAIHSLMISDPLGEENEL